LCLGSLVSIGTLHSDWLVEEIYQWNFLCVLKAKQRMALSIISLCIGERHWELIPSQNGTSVGDSKVLLYYSALSLEMDFIELPQEQDK